MSQWDVRAEFFLRCYLKQFALIVPACCTVMFAHTQSSALTIQYSVVGITIKDQEMQ